MTTAKRNYFMILGQNRCGSTWVQSCLTHIEFVKCDLEMQWEEKVPTELHVPLRSFSGNLDEILEGKFSQYNTDKYLGSKIIFPGQVKPKLNKQLEKLLLESNVKYLHITRNYLDSFLSRLRHAGHLINPFFDINDSFKCISWFQNRLIEKGLDRDSFELDVDELKLNLQNRENVDKFLFSLLKNKEYLLVDYSQIRKNFNRLVKHLLPQINISELEMKQLIEHSPVIKLPTRDYSSIIMNWEEVKKIGDQFEDRRLQNLDINSLL